MTQVTQQKRPLHKTFLFNLIVIFLICMALYWIFFASLSSFTRHGQSIPVPKLVGLSLPNAEVLIKTNNLDVEVDSTYEPDKKPLMVLAQQPDAGFGVKKGHTLFLTVNKILPPTIAMPALISLSYKSAIMRLEANKLVLEDTIMKPSMAQGAVLGQLFNGQPINPGTLIKQGSHITLVVGNGLGKTKMDVPNLIGMSYPEAVALLSGSNLNYQVIFDGTITDTVSAVVYLQNPTPVDSLSQAPNSINEGQSVIIHVQQNNN